MSSCMLIENIKDNYNARFDTPSLHCFREIHLNAILNINLTDGCNDRWTDGQMDGNSNSYVAPCYKQVQQLMINRVYLFVCLC